MKIKCRNVLSFPFCVEKWTGVFEFLVLCDTIQIMLKAFSSFPFTPHQASMNKVEDGVLQGDILYDHFSEKEDLWFDFMADTGDGGNSSYTIARLLAQPSIRVNTKDSFCVLPRGDLLLIGGDLA